MGSHTLPRFPHRVGLVYKDFNTINSRLGPRKVSLADDTDDLNR